MTPHKSKLTRAIVGIVFAGFATGCASTPKGAEADDMSADAHRAAAHAHEAEADTHQKRYDPNASVDETGTVSRLPGFDDVEYITNRTDRHLRHARSHKDHAKAHSAAADALESFESGECAAIKAKTRHFCPLLGAVDKVLNIDGGVRFKVAEGVNRDALVAHMRCHFAFGRTRAFSDMPDCPLYSPKLSINMSADGRHVDLVTSDGARVDDLQRRAHTHAD